jgi:hypothetical protein
VKIKTHLRTVFVLGILSFFSACGGSSSGGTSGASGTTTPSPVSQPNQAPQVQWSGMTNALLVGDKQTAMTYLTDDAKLQYGPVFDTLMPEFPKILPTWSAPIVSKISGNTAEYAIVTDDGTKRQLFYVYYKLGDDGVWRLESM